jgi:HEPN domain-containing protein
VNYDTTCFHCQQAAEKVLKAFLISRNVTFERVHAMVYLVDLCVAQGRTFNELREKAELLSPYAVEVRYPGDVLVVPREDAEEALSAATAIWGFVLKQFPAEARP